MIHGKTAQMKRRRSRCIAAIVAACLAVAVLLFAWSSADADTQDQAALSVRNAVLDSAMQCAAVEGAYPSSLQYLEEHYGLIVNHEDYVVTYEVFAANVPPSVAVMPR